MYGTTSFTTPLEGESIRDYITRMHGGRCDCPRAYQRCRFAVLYDDYRGDRSQGHGGWGWP